MKRAAAIVTCLFALAACDGTNIIDNTGGGEEPPATVAVTGVTLDKPSAVMNPGQTTVLTAEVSPSNATDKTVTWESTDNAVASVDGKGEVMAHKLGSVTITAITKDGNHKASCLVEVTISATGVWLDITSISIAAGKSQALVATVEPEDAINKAVGWESSDRTVATVENGLVSAVAEGEATITVKTADGGFEATCQVTVTVAHPFGQIYFRTAATRTIGTQVWSDVVIATRCQKDDFDGGTTGDYKVDCRQNPGYGHMFSWKAVSRYGEYLCPASQGWRVPSTDDYIALDMELTGTQGVRMYEGHRDIFINEWGATYGGYAHGPDMYSTGSWGRYWSGTGHPDLPDVGLAFYVKKDGEVNSMDYGPKLYGFMLRCVK